MLPAVIGGANLEGVGAVVELVVVKGESQSAKGSLSTLHSNVASGSFELNANVGVSSPVRPAGPESMVVTGAVASTVKVREAGVASVLPTSSVARTSKVCWPSSSGSAVKGGSQSANGPESMRHSKDEGSVELNAKVGVSSAVRPVGPDSIVVSGGVRSTTSKVTVAGL